MSRSRILVLTVLVTFLVAACGDEGRDPKAEQALADKAVLVAADLPEGYEADEESEENEEDDTDPLDECLGTDSDELEETITAESESPNFQRQSDTGIELVGSASAVFDSEDDAEEAADLFATDEARECLNDTLEEELTSGDDGAEITSAGVEEHDFPAVGDQTSGIRMSLSFTAEGQEFPFTMDLAFVREGRVLTLLFFGQLGGAYDADQAEAIARKVVARI